VGYELSGDDGEVVGEADLAWESLKVAYLSPEQAESEGAFIGKGWKTIKAMEEITLSLFGEAR
jgi:DEAD/DEAH box helicase domain-containing protein